MNYWLMKTEPETYSWDMLVKQKSGTWDGVRNYAARNNLKAMKKGDLVFIYHSNSPKAVIGIAKVVAEAFPDPTTKDPAWVAVKVTAQEKLPRPVTLDEMKLVRSLSKMKLLKIGRLSVSPVSAGEWQTILKLAKHAPKS